jgi:hypothetical protein
MRTSQCSGVSQRGGEQHRVPVTAACGEAWNRSRPQIRWQHRLTSNRTLTSTGPQGHDECGWKSGVRHQPAPHQRRKSATGERTEQRERDQRIKVKTFIPVCKEQKDQKTERDQRKPSSAFNRRTLLTQTSLLMEDHKRLAQQG